MPPRLKKRKGTITENVTTLMGKVRSPARKKAIITISKRRNTSKQNAQFINSLAIAKKLARKK